MLWFSHAFEGGLERRPAWWPSRIESWYPEAIIYRVDVRAFCDADADGVGDFDGLARRVPYLASLGVTCVDLFAPDRRDPAGFERFRIAARGAGMRVIVDVAVGDRSCEREDAAFWIERGVDGVILPRFFNARAHATALRRVAAIGDERPWLPFCRVNGVPVPCGRYDDWSGELGAFRAQLVPTIIESFRRQSGVPLLGLIVRLALCMASDKLPLFDDNDHGLDTDRRRSHDVPLRLARLTDGPGPRLNLLHALLFALPGPPVVVFGDEIGMDDLVRDSAGNCSPMRWRQGRIGDAVAVQAQDRLRRSLLNRVRTLADVRTRSKALTGGGVAPVGLGAGPGVAFLRERGGETTLVVANLSDRPCVVECDLNGHQGNPVHDLLGDRQFGHVLDGPYAVALKPYAWHWLRLGHQ